MDELSFQQINVLELMQAHANAIHEAAKTLDDKAQQNISVSSIIVAIVGAFNIVRPSTSQTQSIFTDQDVLLILGVYAVIFVLSFFAKLPREFATHPMKPTWEEAQQWLNLNLEDYYDKLIAAYTNIVEKNDQITKLKAVLVQAGTFFIGVDVLFIFLAVVF